MGGRGSDSDGGAREKRGDWSQRALAIAFSPAGFLAITAVSVSLMLVALWPLVRHATGQLSSQEIVNVCQSASSDLVLSLSLQPLGAARISSAAWMGSTCLHVLSDRGDVALLQLVVGLGVSQAVRDDQGRTALMRAALAGHAGAVTALGRAGADPVARDHAGFSALHLAARAGSPEAVRAVLDLGVPADFPTGTGETALMLAARSTPSRAGAASPTSFSAAFSSPSVSVDSMPTTASSTAGVLEVLAAHGAMLDRPDDVTKCAAVHRAASAADPTALLTLLDAGASPNGPPGSDCPSSPLSTAIMHRRGDHARLLLARGASPSGGGAAGLHPLAAAAVTGQVGLLEVLLSQEGGSTEAAAALLAQQAPVTGRTALHEAVLGGQATAVVHLLRWAASLPEDAFRAVVMQADAGGATAAMLAAGSGEPESVRALLSVRKHTPAEGGEALIPPERRSHFKKAFDRDRSLLGAAQPRLAALRQAQVEARDAAGRTVFHHAARGGSLGSLTAVLESLRLADASRDTAKALLSAPDALGRTPLYTAVDAGHCGLLVDRIHALAPQSVGTPAHDGLTPLLRAAAEGAAPCLTKLLSFGADPAVRVAAPHAGVPSPAVEGATALHLAGRSGAVDALDVLLRLGERAEALWVVDKRSSNPLHEAAASGNAASVLALLDKTPAVDGISALRRLWAREAVARGSSDWSMADAAAAAAAAQAAQPWAPAAGKLVWAVDSQGRTPLHRFAAAPLRSDEGGAGTAQERALSCVRGLMARAAAESRATTAVEAVVAAAALVNASDAQGRTALHVASVTANFPVALALVRVGSDLGAEDGAGFTPLDLAPPAMAQPLRQEVAEERERIRAEEELAEAQERDAWRRGRASLRVRRLQAARAAGPRAAGLDRSAFERSNGGMGYSAQELARGWARYVAGEHHLVLLQTEPRRPALSFSSFERANRGQAFSREEFRAGWLNYLRGMSHRIELQGVIRKGGLDEAAFQAYNPQVAVRAAERKQQGEDAATVDAQAARELSKGWLRYRCRHASHLLDLQFDPAAFARFAEAHSSRPGSSVTLPEARRVGLREVDFAEFNAGDAYSKAELAQGFARYKAGQHHLMHLQADEPGEFLYARAPTDQFNTKPLGSARERVARKMMQMGIPIAQVQDNVAKGEGLGFTVDSSEFDRIDNLSWHQFRTLNLGNGFSTAELLEGYGKYLRDPTITHNVRYQAVATRSTSAELDERIPDLWYFEFGALNDGKGYNRYELEASFVRYVQGDHHDVRRQNMTDQDGHVIDVFAPPKASLASSPDPTCPAPDEEI